MVVRNCSHIRLTYLIRPMSRHFARYWWRLYKHYLISLSYSVWIYLISCFNYLLLPLLLLLLLMLLSLLLLQLLFKICKWPNVFNACKRTRGSKCIYSGFRLQYQIVLYKYWTPRKQIIESGYLVQEWSLYICYSSCFVENSLYSIAYCLPNFRSSLHEDFVGL